MFHISPSHWTIVVISWADLIVLLTKPFSKQIFGQK